MSSSKPLSTATTVRNLSNTLYIATIQLLLTENDTANGTPANGSPDDLNGDGVINQFEADASIAKRQNKGGKNSGTSIIEQLQATFDRNNRMSP